MENMAFGPVRYGKITGEFWIPSYQRGYRWGELEVRRLLDDIYANGDKNYCLQPVVVVNQGNRYELVDGQQRLTTLYIIMKYIQKNLIPIAEINYQLVYQTREASAKFLEDITEELADSDIDFYHIYHAYKAVGEWFDEQENKPIVGFKLYQYLTENVQIIWYEASTGEKPIDLFERLNIGKIPLTNAELVKAMFLNSSNNKNMTDERQKEISLQWDNIENELHFLPFWNFLSNSPMDSYQTNIDLILDLIAKKPKGKIEDTNYTFFKFEAMRKEVALKDIWAKIQGTFLTLKDWFENPNLYNKIGYLIACKAEVGLQEIYDLYENKTKNVFEKELDDLIRKTVALKKADDSYADWNYNDDYSRISDLLLLFNVESTRKLNEKFPFEKYKNNGIWSLEHIHAQQSEGLNKEKQWKLWLKHHIKSVASLDGYEELVSEMQAAYETEGLKGETFKELQEKAVKVLSEEGGIDYMHSICNMALLNSSDNAALNNSTFDVKRNIIVDLDREGKYIPLCTKRVFLKYYTKSENNQIHFWGQSDRIAYVEEINRVLNGPETSYLTKNIIIEQGGEL